jgi:ribosomal protein S18 acetylase RimI-like enzyme
MLKATVVETEEELVQIYELNQANLKQNLTEPEKMKEGFVSWLYSVDLLKQMHRLSPSVIVKDGDVVVGYALATLKEARAFHPDLETMFQNLEKLTYKNKLLSSFRFYCMGQICVAKGYRGKGIVEMLYQKHRQLHGSEMDFLLTEISVNNVRSQKAHEKVGFQTIYTYSDAMDRWNVVVWPWR